MFPEKAPKFLVAGQEGSKQLDRARLGMYESHGGEGALKAEFPTDLSTVPDPQNLIISQYTQNQYLY